MLTDMLKQWVIHLQKFEKYPPASQHRWKNNCFWKVHYTSQDKYKQNQAKSIHRGDIVSRSKVRLIGRELRYQIWRTMSIINMEIWDVEQVMKMEIEKEMCTILMIEIRIYWEIQIHLNHWVQICLHLWVKIHQDHWVQICQEHCIHISQDHRVQIHLYYWVQIHHDYQVQISHDHWVQIHLNNSQGKGNRRLKLK